jgi:hypothetical protein
MSQYNYSYLYPNYQYPQNFSYFSEPILSEVPNNFTNIPEKKPVEESVEELCTNECHIDNCKCFENQNVQNAEESDYDKCSESDSQTHSIPESEAESENEDENTKVHPETCTCEPCFTQREEHIKKMQSELEQKLKIQREYKEQIERQKELERKRKLYEEREKNKKELIDKINKLVGEYNEQSKKCDQLLKTYNAENTKLIHLNTEYSKLKYKLDTYEKNPNSSELNNLFGVSDVLFPFLNLLRK